MTLNKNQDLRIVNCPHCYKWFYNPYELHVHFIKKHKGKIWLKEWDKKL